MIASSPPRALVNARLLCSAYKEPICGGIIIEQGKIKAVGPEITAENLADSQLTYQDCQGHILAPGLLDMRVQIGEPGFEQKEDFDTACQAASAGGVTSMVQLPNTAPPLDSVPMLEYLARRVREIKKTKIYAYGAITSGLEGKSLTEMRLMQAAGAVGFTDGNHAVYDPLVMLRAMRYAQGFDALLVQHPHEPRLGQNGLITSGETATRLGLSGLSPQIEAIMIERDIRLVEMTGCRYHVAHVSTRLAVEVIRRAKKNGLPISCDTAPPYFGLTVQDIGEYRSFAKVFPPLRTEEDRQAICEALADGTIDAIASDHQPQDTDSKRLPFAQAEPGMVGVETLLPLSLTLLYHKGLLDMSGLWQKLTTGPAALLKIAHGKLTAGAAADLVLFDPDHAGKISAAELHSKAKNTLFDQFPVQGRVLATYVDGRSVYTHPDWRGQD